jgi:hypothetical protein
MIEIQKINKISKNNCDLIFFNRFKEFIKTPKRIFFLKAKKNCHRGNHAHKKCSQFLFSVRGSIKINIDNGKKKRNFKIKERDLIKVKPLNWLKIELKKDEILGVICDKDYSEGEYIRDYDKFKHIVNLKNKKTT